MLFSTNTFALKTYNPSIKPITQGEHIMSLEGNRLGQYQLQLLLGSGGMGEVYLAEDARIGQQVAIKVSRREATFYPDSQSLKEALRLFQREARAIAQLDHPHILPLFGYGEEIINGSPITYLVMPYRREGTFANWLQPPVKQRRCGPCGRSPRPHAGCPVPSPSWSRPCGRPARRQSHPQARK